MESVSPDLVSAYVAMVNRKPVDTETADKLADIAKAAGGNPELLLSAITTFNSAVENPLFRDNQKAIELFGGICVRVIVHNLDPRLSADGYKSVIVQVALTAMDRLSD